MSDCPLSGRPCERNCEESPGNPKLSGVCALSVSPPVRATPSVSGPPEADPRPWRKFHVHGAGWEADPVVVGMRCWVCGVGAEFGAAGDVAGLEDLTAWASAHECARLRVPDDVKPEDAPPGGFWHAHPESAEPGESDGGLGADGSSAWLPAGCRSRDIRRRRAARLTLAARCRAARMAAGVRYPADVRDYEAVV